MEMKWCEVLDIYNGIFNLFSIFCVCIYIYIYILSMLLSL